MAASSNPPYEPSLAWRTSSSMALVTVAAICRSAMFGVNRTEVHGLDKFLALLDQRKDVESRTRGLITVSNHISVLDDPFMWGVLPLRYALHPSNMRWSLGSHDLCFKNKVSAAFFTVGQVLPTRRLKYSPYGGLFQPTMREAVRLVSNPHLKQPVEPSQELEERYPQEVPDPFSSSQLTFSTDGIDEFPAPAAYLSRKYSWIHIFPEGRVHQHPQKTMRYFKWGVARLILEPDECPDIVPVWIEGNEQIMPEARQFPRFIPRLGKRLGIWFGDNVAGDQDSPFSDLRRRWQRLVEKDKARQKNSTSASSNYELSDELKYGKEAVNLRKECTLEVRRTVLALRKKRGLPDEDPKAGLVETWLEEGPKREGRMDDGSWVKDT